MPSLRPPPPDGPRAPLDAWPVQIADARFGYAWYCGGGVIVSQASVGHGTEAAAHAYHDLADRVLMHRAKDIQVAGGLYVIHDFRLLATYDSAARKAWQERMKRRGKGYLRGSTVVVAEATPLLKMAVSGINLMASLSLGTSVELATDLVAVLAAHRVERPQGRTFPS